MLWRETGYLCQEKESLDRLRKPCRTFTKRKVFCNLKGVKRSEFYQAGAQGIRPELCVQVKEIDYKGEGHFEHGGKIYRVIRTYPAAGECIELVCAALVVGS